MTNEENNKQVADQIVRSWPYESEIGDGIYELLDFVKANWGGHVLANNDIMNDAVARLGFKS